MFAELDALRGRITEGVAGLPSHEQALESCLSVSSAGSPGRAAA